MTSRSAFLPQFYGGDVWKEFGPEANEMMLEWHNVYLLKLLNEFKSLPDKSASLNDSDLVKDKGIVVIDYYLANDNQLDNLADFFQTDYVPFLATLKIYNVTLWVSEAAENDFPRLPVIQDKNILIAITTYRNESDYQDKLKQIASSGTRLHNQMQALTAEKNSLILYPTNKSTVGNANYEKI